MGSVVFRFVHREGKARTQRTPRLRKGVTRFVEDLSVWVSHRASCPAASSLESCELHWPVDSLWGSFVYVSE